MIDCFEKANKHAQQLVKKHKLLYDKSISFMNLKFNK